MQIVLASRPSIRHDRWNRFVLMISTITVRDIDPKDKSWLQREARVVGISMEEFVRRIIHEKRKKAERHAKPSDAFKHYFGPEHGVDLQPHKRYGYRAVGFTDESSA